MKRICSILIVFLSLYQIGTAQQLHDQNYEYHKHLRLGFSVAMSVNDFKLMTAPDFMDDTLRTIAVKRFPGLELGGIFAYKFGSHKGHDKFEVRMLPSLLLAQRNLEYGFANPARNKIVKIESAYASITTLFKYKAPRRTNLRFYLVGGIRASYDFLSDINTSRSLNKPIVALQPFTMNYELGFGFDMYLPLIKFSPEVRLCQSFKNILVKDDFIYTQAISSIWSRILVFSFNFE